MSAPGSRSTQTNLVVITTQLCSLLRDPLRQAQASNPQNLPNNKCSLMPLNYGVICYSNRQITHWGFYYLVSNTLLVFHMVDQDHTTKNRQQSQTKLLPHGSAIFCFLCCLSYKTMSSLSIFCLYFPKTGAFKMLEGIGRNKEVVIKEEISKFEALQTKQSG